MMVTGGCWVARLRNSSPRRQRQAADSDVATWTSKAATANAPASCAISSIPPPELPLLPYPGLTGRLVFRLCDKRVDRRLQAGLRAATWRRALVIPGLVPGIQPSTCSGVCGALDPGNKCRDDGELA